MPSPASCVQAQGGLQVEVAATVVAAPAPSAGGPAEQQHGPDTETWKMLVQLPMDLQRHIFVLVDVLEVLCPAEAGSLPVRLAAQRYRAASLLSRVHRQAACIVPLVVRLDWPAEPHLSGSAYDPLAALAWARKVGAQLTGVEAPACGRCFLRWHAQLPPCAAARMLGRVEVLTLASLRGGYPNAFQSSQLPELHHLKALHLLHFSRMELAGLPLGVCEVSLVPAGNPLRQLGQRYKVHCTGSMLAPLGSLPSHRLASLRIHSGVVGGAGPYYNPYTVLLLDVQRLCSCAAVVELTGMALSLVLPGVPPVEWKPVPADHDRAANCSSWFQRVCCQLLADAFLASKAERLLLRPAGACDVPYGFSSRDAMHGRLLMATAAKSYVEAAEEHDRVEAGAAAGLRINEYSAPPHTVSVAAARLDAASCGGMVLRPQHINLMEHMPFALNHHSRERLVFADGGQLWGPAVLAAGVCLVRRHVVTPTELRS